MIPNWRTRLFHWSFNSRRVAFAAIMTLVAGFILSLGIALVKGRTSEPLEQRLQRALNARLAESSRPGRTLAEWLHGFLADADDFWDDEIDVKDEPKASAIDGFLKTGRLMGVELRSVIQKHGGAQDQQALFSDFIIARMDAHDERAKAAWKRIESAALRLPAAEFANEFLGCLLEDADKPMEAMNAFRREGEFADAKSARSAVLRLAIKNKETKTLREMLARADYRESASPWIEYEAGELLGDWLMHLRGLGRMELARAKMASLVLAILAALLWYAVFQRFLKDVPWRWFWPLPMFLAGIGSVAITFYLIKKQESLGIVENGTFPNDLLFFIGGVGLREELSKLAAFALFLPWLLRSRSAAAAMLAGAFVGLGFAFEENLDYYAHQGFGVVIGRLLTANFMHAAMTSMAGYALYELVRTRFGSAEKSLLTFFVIVVAHGVYDWAPSAGKVSPVLAGGGVVSFVVLGLLAHRFFDELGVYVVPRRGAVTLVALFLMGVSALVALSMIFATWTTGSLAALSAVGADAAGLVPIAVLYVRRFHHG